MDLKSLVKSTEIMTGVGLIVAGVLAQTAGFHNFYVSALIPFGVGLMLSEVVTRAGKATRERVKVRVRRDGK
jgi:hypothetical protein